MSRPRNEKKYIKWLKYDKWLNQGILRFSEGTFQNLITIHSINTDYYILQNNVKNI